MKTHKFFNLVMAFVFAFSLLGIPAPVLATSQASIQSAPFTTCADVTEISQAECEALVALYISTNGAGWTNHTDWLLTDTPCSWVGVTCAAGMNVTELALGGNNLIGSIPAELGNLTNLVNLKMGGNQLTGFIPSQLGFLANLTRISLDGNQLTGSIPTQLGSLAQLQWLSLGSNQLTGSIPIQLGNLTNLWWLYLGSNQLTGSIPPELGNATNLTNLDLSSNQLTGFIPAQLGNLMQLTKLRLENNQLSGSIPAELGSLTQLHTLELSNNQLTGSIPAELGSLAQLTILWLEQNQLSGSIPVQLGNLTQLTDLGLRLNQLSGSIPAELGNLTQLTWLGLCGNQLTGNIPTELGNLTQLTWLSLCDSQLTGSIPTEMGNLTQLTELFLHGTELSGEFPTSITNLINLTTLTFDCGLTSSDPAVIAFLNEKSPGWQANQCIPYPSFAAHLPGNQVHAYNWTAGSTLTLTIDDPDILGSPDFQTTGIVPDNDLYGNTWTVFELPNFELKPRQSMSITDGSITKDHVVSTVTVTSVDFNSDIILGTAEPNTIVGINAHYNQGGDYVHRNIIADSNGNWMVNLSIPGSNSGEDRTYDIMTGSWGTAFQCDEDNDSTFYGWQVVEPPNFHVRPNQNQIHAFRWPVGSQVHVIVDDPTTQNPIDYEETQEAVMTEWFSDMTFIIFNVQGMTLKPGQTVTMTDGITTKAHVIQELNVTNIDPGTDTFEGTAVPGQSIFANVYYISGQGGNCSARWVTANDQGKWIADFSIPGDGNAPNDQALCDIKAGSNGDANIRDEDGDFTTWGWSLPPAPLFMLNVNNASSWGGLDAWNWPLGSDVTLTVDDPNTIQNPDYTEVQTMGQPSDGGHTSHAMFMQDSNFEGHPGFTITLSDGIQTKTMIVPLLAVTGYDIVNDTITGVSDPFAIIQVPISHTYGPDWVEPTVVADSEGNWQADLAGTFDIQPGDYVELQIHDADWDHIVLRDWRVPKYGTTFWFFPETNSLESGGWPLNEPIHLLSDDPSTPQNPDYDYIVYAQPADPGRGVETWLNLTLPPEHIIVQPGFTLTISGGGQSRSYLISSVNITSVDIMADTIEGYSEPASLVVVNVDETRALRRVIADQNGYWQADFSIPGDESDEFITDIKPGFGGLASVWNDGDLGATAWQWTVPNPFIIVQPEEDRVFGFDWPVGTLLELEIDDPETSQSPDYTASQVFVESDDWGNGFELNGLFDIQPDHVVTVSGENITRQHAVTHLAVTNIDVDADTISGTGYPGAMIHVGAICDETGCATRNINVDENGNWIADFSVPVTGHGDAGMAFDLLPGMSSSAYEFDTDEDATNISWNIPNPNFDVRANYDLVEGWEWNLNSTVTIAIDDPSTQTNPDYTDTAIVSSADWDPSQTYVWFYLSGVYDIQPGNVVSMNDDSTTKTTIVTNLVITDVHPGTGIAEGMAEPNQIINVWTCWQDTCANRDETADQNGYWATNFIIPGEQDWEQETLDVRLGSWIDSSVEDKDGDSTMFGLTVPYYSMHANFKGNEVHGHDWPGSSMVTLTIDNDTDPTNGVLYTETKQADEDTSCGLPCFNLQGLFTLQRGQIVTMSDSDVTKVVRVSTLDVISMDIEHDTISGVADPGSTISVDIHSSPQQIGRRVVADANGQWVVDFSTLENQNGQGIYDLIPGSFGRAVQLNPDDTDDGTLEYWSIPINEPPIAEAGADQTALEGDTVILNASASSDPNGDALTYEWDINADGQYDDATGVTPNVTFPDNKTYIVSLKVTDPLGLNSTDTMQIIVSNVTPTVTIQQSSVNNLGVFTGSGSFTDPGADTWTATVNYGDKTGTRNLTLNPDKTFALNHPYAHNGTYVLKVCVTDDDGGKGCTQTQVKVTINHPPLAEADGPYYGNEGSSITLDASRSTDPDNNIVLYEWDFDNDGLFDDALGARPKFTAIDNGIFTVRVRVTDAGGLSSEDNSTVTVKNVPPVITSLTFNSSVRVGVKLNTYATFKDAGVNDTFTATWKWGDGTTSTGAISGKTVNGSHTYTKPGIYLVTIMVKDKDGGVGQAYKLIFVLPKR